MNVWKIIVVDTLVDAPSGGFGELTSIINIVIAKEFKLVGAEES